MAQKSLRKECGDLKIKIQTEERKLKEASKTYMNIHTFTE